MLKPTIASFLLALLSVVCCTQCAGPGARSDQPTAYVPRVSMPDRSQLSANENRYLPEVENALVQAGYEPTSGPAEYRQEIHLEVGPVNADSRLTLWRGNAEIARGAARVGGMTTLFRQSQVVAESFHRSLAEFQSQLRPVPGGSGAGPRGW
jgi:hypothetical protein